MTDEPVIEYEDLDRDGVPDMIDREVDPAPVEFAPLREGLTEEELLEMQRQAEEQGQVDQVLTNVQHMKHESLKGISQNLRG
jgi:hypothetical protein